MLMAYLCYLTDGSFKSFSEGEMGPKMFQQKNPAIQLNLITLQLLPVWWMYLLEGAVEMQFLFY
jgi:hypothetical protein